MFWLGASSRVTVGKIDEGNFAYGSPISWLLAVSQYPPCSRFQRIVICEVSHDMQVATPLQSGKQSLLNLFVIIMLLCLHDKNSNYIVVNVVNDTVVRSNVSGIGYISTSD